MFFLEGVEGELPADRHDNPSIKVINEEEKNPFLLSSGRPSVREAVSRTKASFRTFQGSRKGGYTVNGPKLQPDYPHESIPLTVSGAAVTDPDLPPPVPSSPLPQSSDDDSDREFPSPPPEEFYSALNSPVEVLAIRPFDDQEQAATPPAFDGDVQHKSPLSRSVG